MIVNFPHVNTISTYNLIWNLGILALQGKGDNTVTLGMSIKKNVQVFKTLINFTSCHLDNVIVHAKLIGSIQQRNNQNYLKIDNAQVIIKSAQMKVYFDNLFNGQKELERTANEVINQNVEILKSDVFPIVEQSLGKILLKISNEVFSSAPYSEIFPQLII